MNDTVNTNEVPEVVEASEAVETAVVADYLALVKEDKMEEAAAYITKFFGEGENLNLNALGKFQDEVTAAVGEELAEEAVEEVTE